MAEFNKQADIAFQQDQLAKKLSPPNDPERPPAKKPGDAWVVGGTVVGLVAGAAIGGLFAFMSGVFVVAPAGILLGGFGGLVAGSLMKRRLLEKAKGR